MKNDIRYAWRMIAKNPGFTAAAVLTMTLGIGLNSAVFSVVNAMLFKPLPVAVPEELVSVYSHEDDGFMSHVPVSFPDFADLRAGVPAFADMIAYASTPLAMESEGESDVIMGELVTGNFFTLLGVDAALGRTFTAADDEPADPRLVAVLNHGSWRRRFGADPDIVGKTVRLNGHLFTVLGVAPEGFNGLIRGLAPELWVPIQVSRALRIGMAISLDDAPSAVHRLDNRQRRWLWAMGRLAPEAEFGTALTQVETLGQRLAQEYPETNEDRVLTAVPSNEVRLIPGIDRVLYATSLVVMGLVSLVLLIACANLANMFLARTLSRQKEIATRLALGAGRGRIVRQLLVESLALTFLGGFFGLGLAFASNAVLNAVQLPIPVQLALGLSVDFRVALFTLFVASMTAVIFGLAPARAATRTDLAPALHDGSRGSTGGAAKGRLRNALVVGQVALSFLLLICAGLSVRSMLNARGIDPGFDASRVAVARFAPDLQGYDRARSEDFYRRLTERLAAMPGVDSVSSATMTPLSFEIRIESVAPEGQDTVPVDEWPSIDGSEVAAGYFATMDIPILRGREFSAQDTVDVPRVAVVNEALAARFWPGENALGKRLRVDNADHYYEVVGIAANSKYRTLGEDPRPYVFRNVAQQWSSSQVVLVKTAEDPSSALGAIRQVARELDEKIAVSGLETLEDAISVSLILPRMGATLFGLFGVVGLLLAAVGIYGVMSYTISRRTHEIGIRMAMGARRVDVLGLMVRQGLWLTGLGLALGLGGAILTTRALEAVLYGISATDLLTFVGVSLFLGAVALLASFIPARRASRIDPLVALRCE